MHNKNVKQVTQELSYIQDIGHSDSNRGAILKQYLKPLLHSGLGKILKGVKSKGFNALTVLQFLSFLPLLGIASISSLYKGEYPNLMLAKKDVFYRLKNNPNIPWRRLLASIAKRFRSICIKRQGQTEVIENKKGASPKCLIFDDTDIEKTGFLIEGVSKIWSHRFHRYVLGFKLLVIGYYDGHSLLPIDFSIHREQGKKKAKKKEGSSTKQQYGLKPKTLKKQYLKKRSQTCAGKARKEELDKKKTNVVFEMIKRAYSAGFKAEYVLCDSWFFSIALLTLVLSKGMNLVSGVKMGKMNVEYNGKVYSIKNLVSLNQRKQKYSRKLKIHYIDLIVNYKGVALRLFFIRYGNQKKWRIIVNSNTKKNFTQTLEIYQIRWSIEVFFKDMKQHLGLAKCQSRDFDAHIAHVTLAMILYLALALKKRVDNHQTIGELFREAKNQIIESTLHQKVWKVFCLLISKLSEWFDFDPKVIFREIYNNSDSQLNTIIRI